MVTALLSNTLTLPNVGSVKASGVGVYWDSGCSTIVSLIDWGVIEAGSTKVVMVCIRNEGNADVTLSLGMENWSPLGTSSYITLGWDYAGQSVGSNEVI